MFLSNNKYFKNNYNHRIYEDKLCYIAKLYNWDFLPFWGRGWGIGRGDAEADWEGLEGGKGGEQGDT